MKHVPIIQIDFNDKSLIFTQPIKIICATSTHELWKCLKDVEHAQKNGYYVAGFISYEASQAFQKNINIKQPNHFPLLWFGIFKEPSNIKPLQKQSYQLSDWELSISKDRFIDVFKKIEYEINNNSIEQINYTTQYEAKFSGNGYSYYKQLKKAQQANYSAYIHTGNYEILSASPELFFELNNDTIRTKPMKGTIDRGLSFEDDIAKKKWLKSSSKNIIENDLTTELMCKELEKISKTNTVQVVDRHQVEQYPTVFQMTSTIESKLRPEISFKNIIQTIFPCASITGSPKIEAMRLINEIEENHRNIYCGTIGYITPNNNAIFNVPIRTVLIDHEQNKATYGVGGAITKESTVEEEFTEIKTKAKILQRKQPSFQLLETFGLKNGEYIVFDNHLNRLKRSATYFNFNLDLDDIKQALSIKREEYKDGNWRLRLLVSKQGSFTIEIYPLDHIDKNPYVKLAEKPLQKNNPFLYHKTTYRDIYDQFKITDDQYFDVLLWNEDKEITEFTIGNIVVKLDGKLLTPPIESGLLAGTFRQKLLQEGKIKERKIYLHDLNKCSHIWFINSVRKWISVKLSH